MTIALEILAVTLGYLIGAVPTAYVLVRTVKGIDIRTLGSGNVGATNAGRVLGAWGFVTVFVIDLLKGLLPTWGLPVAVRTLAGEWVPSLPVLVGVAAILGHNFPIYLKFKGGKGVATSLGVVLALDPRAAEAAAFAFVVILLVTRIVSISSLLAGMVFVTAHFALIDDPWSRDQVVLSVALLLLLALLVFRHRTNLVRIARGNEPRVSFGPKVRPPSGRIGIGLVIVLLVLAVGTLIIQRTRQPAELHCGRFSLVVTDRAKTGHQRAERVAFLDRGRLVAVTCPRYDRLVLFQVTDEDTLTQFRDVKLSGKPVALWPTPDQLYVLQRPSGDARHLVPGFWQVFDFQGHELGSKFPVGYDPDDLVLIAGGRVALVLLSGHAEGETNRSDPSLVAIDLQANGQPRIVSEVLFDHPRDDPDALNLSRRETHAAVVLRGTEQIAGIDLADPLHPRITGRVPLAERKMPYVSISGDDQILMPVRSDRHAIAITEPRKADEDSTETRRYLACTRPDASAIEVASLLNGRSLGCLPVRGPGNLGTVIPMALGYSPERNRLALADRSGGVHLIAIRAGASGRVRSQ